MNDELLSVMVYSVATVKRTTVLLQKRIHHGAPVFTSPSAALLFLPLFTARLPRILVLVDTYDKPAVHTTRAIDVTIMAYMPLCAPVSHTLLLRLLARKRGLRGGLTSNHGAMLAP